MLIIIKNQIIQPNKIRISQIGQKNHSFSNFKALKIRLNFLNIIYCNVLLIHK